MTEWQTFETAPKDGTCFLAYCEEEEEEGNGFYGMCVLNYDLEHKEYFDNSVDGYIVFSHWMPLPPEPETKS